MSAHNTFEVDFGFDEAQQRRHDAMVAYGRDLPAGEAGMAALGEAGVLGLPVPKPYGGGGESLVTTALAFEGLGRGGADGGVLLAAGAHLFGLTMPVVRVGTETQQKQWLPRLATGALMGTVAATESDAGSDIAQVAAELVDAEGGWHARGHKRYVTWADRAAAFLFVGRRPSQRGLTCVLVERSDGVSAGAAYAVPGLREARLAPVVFEDAPVDPELGLLGKAGAGMAVFQLSMAFERALVLAFRLGTMQAQLDAAIDFARKRRVGGKVIATHQAVSHRIARMHQRLESARLLTYRAAWCLDRGERAQLPAALAKWTLADVAVDNALDAARLRGGAAYEGDAFTSELTDVFGGTIHSGTADVLASIVAAWLGL